MFKLTLIKLARMKKGINQKEFAKKMRLSQFHYNGIENGKRKASLQTLIEICDYLELNLLDVIRELGYTSNELN